MDPRAVRAIVILSGGERSLFFAPTVQTWEQILIEQNTSDFQPPAVILAMHVSYWRKRELKLPPSKLA